MAMNGCSGLVILLHKMGIGMFVLKPGNNRGSLWDSCGRSNKY